MRNTSTFTLALLFALLFAFTNTVWAVPVTGGTGPGGIESVTASSDLVHWLDATGGSFTFSGGDVATWGDDSFSGNNMSTHGSAAVGAVIRNASVAAVNGMATVAFAGGSSLDRMNTTSDILLDVNLDNDGGPGLAAFAVYAMDDAVGNDTVWSSTTNLASAGTAVVGTNQQFFRSSADSIIFHAGLSAPTAGVQAVDTFRVRYVDMLDGVGSKLLANGITQSSPASSAVGYALNNIAGGTGCCAPMDGQLAESIIYDRPLNVAERQIVENYLSAKYNLGSTVSGSNNTLGANDYYAGDLDSNGDYDLDVFGIGDDGVDSVTTSGSAGLGLEETGGTLDSGEFVLAGHKTTSNGLTAADTPDGRERWERVWYLDTNGGTVDATLGFGWSDSGLVSSFDPTFGTLLYSPTDPYSFSDLVVGPSSVVGDQVFFDLTGLQTGYYTLAQSPVPEPSSLLLLSFGLLGFVRQSRRAKGRA